VIVFTGVSKHEFIDMLVCSLGGPVQSPTAVLDDNLARIADDELARLLAARPDPPVPVVDLLESRACSAACLLARGSESTSCTCRCRGQYHAALISAEIAP
jgi:hypothetical protein